MFKKINTYFFIGFAVFLMATVSSASMFTDYQTVNCYSNLVENRTSNVEVMPIKYFDCISEVMFEPWRTGTWKLSLIGKNPAWYQKPCGAVQVAWKDCRGDNQWHVFAEQNVIFGIFTNIILYSGKSSISYRVRLANQADLGGYISATPLFMY